jgi:hypothetical protein
MGLEVEKVQGQFIFLKIDSLFQQNMCQNGAWCPCSYYITTFEHYPYFPLIFESLNCMRPNSYVKVKELLPLYTD